MSDRDEGSPSDDPDSEAQDDDDDDGTALSLQMDEDWSPPPPSVTPAHRDTSEPLAVDPPYEARPVPEFMGSPSFVADAFRYPLRGRGPSTIVIGALLVLGVHICLYLWLVGIIALILGGAFAAAFYFNIVSDTLSGKEDVPDWPSLGDDMAVQLIRMIFLTVLSLGPSWVVELALDDTAALYGPLYLLALAWSVLYWPMSVLAAQVRGTVFDALPHVVLPAIRRCLPHYLLAAGIFIAVRLSMEFYGEWAAAIPVAGFILSAPVWVYALLVKARVIGLIYRAHRDAIGWSDGLD